MPIDENGRAHDLWQQMNISHIISCLRRAKKLFLMKNLTDYEGLSSPEFAKTNKERKLRKNLQDTFKTVVNKLQKLETRARVQIACKEYNIPYG